MFPGDGQPTALVDPLTVAKTVAMLALGLGSFALGVAPLGLAGRWRSGPPGRRRQRPGDTAAGSRAVSLLLCFGGGVLLCTTMLHVQPEAREAVAALQRAGRLPGPELLGDMLFCAGFFVVLVADELARAALDRRCFAAGDEPPPSASVSLTSFREATERELQDSTGSPQRRHGGGGDTDADGGDTDVDVDTDGGDDVETQRAPASGGHSLRGLLAVLALSFHEAFEGLAVGLEPRADHVWYLLAAVATHKLVVAYCVGLDLAWSDTRRPVAVAYVATFALVTPVGIACGVAVTRFAAAAAGERGHDGSPGPVTAVLQALAAGTLLYVVFFEVLARHRQSGWSHLAAIAVGFGALLALQIVTHHHHGHAHSHYSYDFGHNHDGGQDHGYGEGQDYGYVHDTGHDRDHQIHEHQHDHGHGR